MKKGLIITLVVLAVLVGGGMYAWNKAKSAVSDVVNTFKGGEISKPKMENWPKLKKGMSVKEAQDLLGAGVTYSITVNDEKTTYLVYTYSDGLLAAPSDKGHNLKFDGSDKLLEWSEPKKVVVEAEKKKNETAN